MAAVLLLAVQAVHADDRTPEEIAAAAGALVASAEVAYVSDYLSFAGRDERGVVLFALDTNRGRAGAAYQAEHFVALYDATAGWIDVPGYDEFPNTEERLLEWPASPYFEASGGPFEGLEVTSTTMALALAVEPLVPRVTVQDERTLFSLASAGATLEIGGRLVRGRVIYEYLVMADANRLGGVSLAGLWRRLTAPSGFQGLYLATADGDDLYLHETAGGAAAGLAPTLAFLVSGGDTEVLRDVHLEVVDHAFAPGLFRWPRAWRAAWRGERGAAALSVAATAHDTQKSWVIGGFAMQAVEGTLRYGDREVAVFGFGELIR
ncbi:MAG TPA: hypothetical protein VIN61_13520 [Gammaproteobacteria bacterium]